MDFLFFVRVVGAMNTDDSRFVRDNVVDEKYGKSHTKIVNETYFVNLQILFSKKICHLQSLANIFMEMMDIYDK